MGDLRLSDGVVSAGGFKTAGDIETTSGSIIAGGVDIASAELGALDGVTAGVVLASKAVIVDANKDIGTFRHLTLSGNLITGTTTLSEAELAVVDGVTAGAVLASKALVVDSNKDLATLRHLTISGNLITGTTTLSEAELAVLDSLGSSGAELDAVADKSAHGVVRVYKVPMSAQGTGTETDSGIDLPTTGVVLDCWLDVTTAEATGGTKTLDAGLKAGEGGGDADGFGVALDVSAIAAGVRPQAVLTAGSSETYFSATTRGALLATFLAGSDAVEDVGTNYEFPHILNGTAVSVVYTEGSGDWVEFVGDLYIVVMEW